MSANKPWLIFNKIPFSWSQIYNFIKINFHFFTNQKNIGQKYISGTTSSPFNTIATPTDFATGSLVLTKTEDATPSLLINLPKNEHLPDGVGGKGFVIMPDNLHPHVKKNLIHFLAKAGVSLNLDTIPALDTTFETLS